MTDPCFVALRKLLPDYVPDEKIRQAVSQVENAKALAGSDQMKLSELLNNISDNLMRDFVAEENIKLDEKIKLSRVKARLADPAYNGDYMEALKGVFVGSNKLAEGAMDSVGRRFSVNKEKLNATWSKLEQKGLYEVALDANSGIEGEVLKQNYEFRKGSLRRIEGISGSAYEIARALQEHTQASLAMRQEAGIPTIERQGYIPQHWDPALVRKVPKAEFINDISGNYDMKSAYPGKSPSEVASEIGRVYDDIKSEWVDQGKPKGKDGKGARFTRERVWDGVSPEQELEMRKKYSGLSLAGAVELHGRASAREAANASMFGANWRNTQARLINEATQAVIDNGITPTRIEDKAAQKLRDFASSIIGEKNSDALREAYILKAKRAPLEWARQSIAGELSGNLKNPGAAAGAQIRSVVRMQKLGFVAVNSVMPDFVTSIHSIRNNVGGNLLEHTVGLMKASVRLLKPEDQKTVLRRAMLFHDAGIGEHQSRFDTDGYTPGRIANLERGYNKANLMEYKDQWQKAAAANQLYDKLYQEKHLTFDKLPEDTLGSFKTHSIGEAEWNAIRLAQDEVPLHSGGTHSMLTPQALEDLPDAVVGAFKQSALDKFMALTHQTVETAVPTTSAKADAYLSLGSKPGTIGGELWRTMAMFRKWQVITFDLMAQSRERYGLRGLFSTAAMLTASAYTTKALKDLIAGKTPDDPNNIQVVRDAFISSGAGGLAFDAAFGEWQKYGNVADYVLGPVLAPGNKDIPESGGDIARMYKAVSKAMDNAEKNKQGDDKSVIGPLAVRLYKSIPGNNLFYMKNAWEYLFARDLAERLHPGLMARTQSRIQSEGRVGSGILAPNVPGYLPFGNPTQSLQQGNK